MPKNNNNMVIFHVNNRGCIVDTLPSHGGIDQKKYTYGDSTVLGYKDIITGKRWSIDGHCLDTLRGRTDYIESTRGEVIDSLSLNNRDD